MKDNEAFARQTIDAKLSEAGWVVQDYEDTDLTIALGVVVREFQTETGPVDYLMFVNKVPIGIIEAKKNDLGHNLTEVEHQSDRYRSSSFKVFDRKIDVRFVYQSTGERIRFTDYNDIDARSRDIFSFQKPEYLHMLMSRNGWTIRNALKKDMPNLRREGLRNCQYNAIVNLQKSMADNNPRSLIQMATGSGKTYTAITSTYRLLRYAKANRVLFLVDTRNLGKQALDEFTAYKTEDSRSFTEVYNVVHLKQSVMPQNSNVYICTIQRMFSMLTGMNISEEDEESPLMKLKKENIRRISYNPSIPPEFFDMIIVDECHRSIYNVWSQIFDYFDAFLVGLTATPDSRTLAFFNSNLVSEYTREQAIIDNVNVGSDTYIIKTSIQKNGATIHQAEVEKRDRLTRAKRWEQLEEDLEYEGKDLDRSVVNKSTIRAIIKEFKSAVENDVFKDRDGEVPKTLIFAKDDSHADDIVDIVREVFGKGNDFCQKITYKADNPEYCLNCFRNEYNPRIVVTVDMIATGTDVKPIECLVFMRDIRSKNYFEQMVGRGTRTLNYDDLKKVSPNAKSAKTHFVIFDACEVTSSVKMETRDLIVDRGPSLKELLEKVGIAGVKDEDTLTTLAGRLTRLNHTLTNNQNQEIKDIVGEPLHDVITGLLDSFDGDIIEEYLIDSGITKNDPHYEEAFEEKREAMIEESMNPIRSAKFRNYILEVRRLNEQVIDMENVDAIESSGWDVEGRNNATRVIDVFRTFIKEHEAEIKALGVFYGIPYEHRSKLLGEVKNLCRIMENEYHVSIDQVHDAYHVKVPDNGLGAKSSWVDLISMIRYELRITDCLDSFKTVVNRNFKEWSFQKNKGPVQFTSEQMEWLRMIRDHVASSLSIEIEDLDYAPFDQMGGFGAMSKVFDNPLQILNQLNDALIACRGRQYGRRHIRDSQQSNFDEQLPLQRRRVVQRLS